MFVVIAMVVKPRQYMLFSLTTYSSQSTVVCPPFSFCCMQIYQHGLGLMTHAKTILNLSKLFNTGHFYLYLSCKHDLGYPVGAKLVSDMYATVEWTEQQLCLIILRHKWSMFILGCGHWHVFVIRLDISYCLPFSQSIFKWFAMKL